jgi:predicted  nucleic acid-binding Zn-ribbon protein
MRLLRPTVACVMAVMICGCGTTGDPYAPGWYDKDKGDLETLDPMRAKKEAAEAAAREAGAENQRLKARTEELKVAIADLRKLIGYVGNDVDKLAAQLGDAAVAVQKRHQMRELERRLVEEQNAPTPTIEAEIDRRNQAIAMLKKDIEKVQTEVKILLLN